ncbi:MAG: hypothetical protein ACRDQZ_24040 [Mycobacteriales bacterium]
MREAGVVGLYWSTPRVLGFGFSTRGPGCGGVLGGIVLFGLFFELTRALIHAWYITVPVIVVLTALAWYGKRTRRRANAPWPAADKSWPQSQASISNRR